MKMKRKLVFFFLVILIISNVYGCSWQEEKSSLPETGMRLAVKGMPKVGEFSGESLEAFEDQFPPVSYATYYHNGTEEDIPANDPRLITLLNLIAYSKNEHTNAMMQGYLEDDEVKMLLSNAAAHLEVVFLPTDSASDILAQTQILQVCGASCLHYINVKGNGQQIQPEYPYMSLLLEMVENGEIAEQILLQESDLHNQETPWLDLLEYSGF